MTRKLITAAAFCGGLLLLILALSVVVSPKTTDAELGYDQVLAAAYRGEAPDTVDVLFFGDSEVYYSIAPLLLWRDYGISSCLCSTNEQEPYETAYFLKQTLKTQTPKVVVLQVNEMFVEPPLGEAVRSELEAYFPLLRYHDRWKTLTREDFLLESHFPRTDRKGYWYTEKINAPEEVLTMDASREPAGLPDLNTWLYRRMQAQCSAIGAKLVFLVTPSAAPWAGDYHSGAAEMAAELGADFLDLNAIPEQIAIDWNQDSADGGFHLNRWGAEKVTTFLGSYLADTGLLPDHRGDPAYASWQEAHDRISAAGEF